MAGGRGGGWGAAASLNGGGSRLVRPAATANIHQCCYTKVTRVSRQTIVVRGCRPLHPALHPGSSLQRPTALQGDSTSQPVTGLVTRWSQHTPSCIGL